jgi:hypothetical protein
MNNRLVVVVGSLLWFGCGGGAAPPASESSAPPAAPASQAAVKRVAACSLFTKAEIETLVGRPVMEGRQDDAAEVSGCEYGNPEAPIINGTRTDVTLNLSIFNGTLPNQAKGVYEIAKRNAAGVEAVNGLGNEAFWDAEQRTLYVVKGNYLVDVMLTSGVGGLKPAQAIAQQSLAKLP